MKQNQLLKSIKNLFFTVLITAFFAMQTTEVSATHFRGGILTWQQAGGNSITFSLNTQWRRGFFPGQTVGSTNNLGSFTFGDATTATIIATVNAIDILNDISFMTWTFTKTYAAPGNYNASALNSCCRISTLQDGNNDKSYSLGTIVNVGGPPFNNSPISNLPPIVNLPIGATNATFTIPGSDPDNDPLTYRVSSIAEASSIAPQMVTTQPAGFSLSTSGVATMNTTTRSLGQLFAIQIMIEDGKTKTPVDFIIRMVGASAPPIFVSPSPAQNTVFNVTPPGNLVSFTIAATDPDAGQTTTLNSVAVPVGSTMSPVLPVTSAVNGTIQSTFNWTPAVAQVGSYIINFVAQDNVGVQAFRSITINVLCPLAITVTNSTGPTCANSTDGSISVSIQNASAPANLLFSWTGPGVFTSNQQNISGLATGTYNLRVDDIATGCFSIKTVILNSVNSAPTISCTNNITANNDAGQCGANVTYPDATATGNPAPAITYSHASGSFFPVGTTTVTATATNICGTESCTFTVTVNDNQPPAISCPTNITVPCGSPIPDPDIASVVATDNCPGITTVIWDGDVESNSNCPGSYTIIRTYKATDASNNSATCTQTITVVDNTAPTLTVPANVTVQCNTGFGGSPLQINFSPNYIEGTYNVGTAVFGAPLPATPLTADAILVDDGFGGAGNPNDACESIINDLTGKIAVIERSGCEPPTSYFVNKAYKAQQAGAVGVIFIFNQPGNHVATMGLPPGPNPTITIPLMLVSNDYGNTLKAELLAGDVNVSLLAQTVIANDECSFVEITHQETFTPGDCPSAFTIVNTWTATDQCGNATTASQTITVIDNTPPTFLTVPANVTLQCSDPLPPSKPLNINSSPNNMDGTFIIGIAFFGPPLNTTPVTGNLLLVNDGVGNPADACEPITNNLAGKIAVIDRGGCGEPNNFFRNKVLKAQNAGAIGVIVVNNLPGDGIVNMGGSNPSITIPSVLVSNNYGNALKASMALGTVNASLSVSPVVAVDNCSLPTLTHTKVITPGSCPNSYSILNTWTASDDCNNVATASQTITVIDNTKPVISVQNIATCFADDNFGCSINLGATATDNCGLLSFTSNAPVCFPVGTTTVTWTATDECGNVTTATQTVTRNPEININICAGPTSTIYTGTVGNVGPFGPQSVNLSSTVTGGTPGYSYKWTPSTGLNNSLIANPVASPAVTTTYTLTVTDSKGCKRTLSITINVLPLSSAVCSSNGNNLKFLVCHIPPGNPSNAHNICISVNALNAHLTSGSNGHNNCYLGPCQQNCFSTIPGAASLITSRQPVEEVIVVEAPIAELQQPDFRVNVYPNPSAYDFSIQILSKSNEPVTVRILDMNGTVRSVQTQQTKTNSIKVGKNLVAGTYFAEVTQGSNKQLVKLVKLN